MRRYTMAARVTRLKASDPMCRPRLGLKAFGMVGRTQQRGAPPRHVIHDMSSRIHGANLLPFEDFSLFLSQLVGRTLIIELAKRVESRKGTNS